MWSGFLLERDDEPGHVVKKGPCISTCVHARLNESSLFFQVGLLRRWIAHAKVRELREQDCPSSDEWGKFDQNIAEFNY